MAKGKVKFFNEKNKFGFIIEDGTGKEFYFHAKDVSEAVKEGEEVTFETEDRKRGIVAIKVKKTGLIS